MNTILWQFGGTERAMANIKLVYFDIRGRAEMLRLMLKASGLEYEEETIQFKDWPELKPKTPYGTLPYMVYNGKVYGQSVAIGPFLAKELGFYGQSNEDALRIDEVTGLWEDLIRNAFVKIRWGKDPQEKSEAFTKCVQEDIPRYFRYFSRFLEDNGGTGFIVGSSLTLADFYIYDMVDNALQLQYDVMKDYPLLQKLRHNVEANPRVKAYLERRKPRIF